MGLGPSLHLKPIEDRTEISLKCPVSDCPSACSPYSPSVMPKPAGRALAAGLVTVHTAVTSAASMSQLKQLPAAWLDVTADIMSRVHQQRSAIAVALARRLEECHEEFRCTDVSPSCAFPRYWSCGVMLDNYLSLAQGEMPPQFHVHIDDLKLQAVSKAFVDVVTAHFPELMNKNTRCILKKFLKVANNVLNDIESGEDRRKDDEEVQVTEKDPEFPPQDTRVYWFPTVSRQCGMNTSAKCPYVFCKALPHKPEEEF